MKYSYIAVTVKQDRNEHIAEVVNFWNECHKRNGQYLFDTEWKEARAV